MNNNNAAESGTRLIAWPTDEEITITKNNQRKWSHPDEAIQLGFALGFEYAVEWLSSRLQEETNVNTDKK